MTAPDESVETVRDYALGYAAEGYRVLPLHTITETLTDDGMARACSCLRPDCRSAGKHPRLDLAQHGVYDATTDAAVIAAWPADGYNLGIAMTAEVVAIDIDDSDIAEALLAPEVGLADREVVDRTRRGLHLIVYALPSRSSVIKTADGWRVGEIRAEGEYVVVPPSRHVAGTYHWLGASILDLPRQTPYPGTAYDYISGLLKAELGIELAPEGGLGGAEALPGGATGVAAIGDDAIPFKIRLGSILRQLLDGVRPVKDRSDTLYLIACECYRTAAKQGVDVDPMVVAGIVRHADRHYRKFSDRADADRRYYECAARAQADVNATQGELPLGDAPAPTPIRPTRAAAPAGGDSTDIFSDGPISRPGAAEYDYRPDEGFVHTAGRATTIICNFEPRIIEQRVIYTGDPGGDAESEWLLRLRLDDEVHDLVVTEAQYSDPRSLVMYLRRRLPPHYVIEARRDGLLLSGIQHTSGVVPVRTVYAAPGWLPDRDAFLVPGLPGAIVPYGATGDETGDGYDPAVIYETAGDRALAALLADDRAVGAQPPDVALQALIDTGRDAARVIVPILTQIAAAPLTSVGYTDGAWLHVYGPTGTFKTSVVEALLAVYGYTPNKRALGITSWAADTDGVIRKWWHAFRDLPCLIDDFKTGIRPEAAVTSLIQSFGDGRGRGRLQRDGRMGHADDPRGLPITTGEDVWETQRSAVNRTILVEMTPDIIDLGMVRSLQAHARNGALGALGVAWLRWLTTRGRDALAAYLAAEPDRQQDTVARVVGADAARITRQVTALFTVSRLFNEFVRETASPAVADAWRAYAQWGWLALFEQARNQAAEAAQLSPLRQIFDLITDHVRGGRACFVPRTPLEGTVVGMPGSRAIGFVDRRAYYLTRALTYDWFLEERARTRRDAGFSWNQVTREIARAYGTMSVPQHTATETGSGSVRMIAIPLAALDIDGAVIEFEDSTHP